MSAETPPQLSELLAHRAFLERFARSLARDADAAEDLVQETWLTALERPPQHRGNLRAWLQRVMRNAFLERQRRPAVEPTHAEVSAERTESPEESHERDAVSRLLGAELLALADLYRRVLILRYYEGKTPSEIARELGRPVNTVTSQLARGLKMMQERLDRAHPGGRSEWVRVLVGLLPGSAPGTVPSARRGNPIASASRSTRAKAMLGVALVAVVAAVIVLRDRMRGPEEPPDGTRVAERDASTEQRHIADLPDAQPSGADASAVPPPDATAARVALAPEPEPEPPAPDPGQRLVVEVVAAEGSPVPGANVQPAIRKPPPPGSSDELTTFEGRNLTDAEGRVEIRLSDEQRVRTGSAVSDLLGVHVQAHGFANSGAYMMPFPESEVTTLQIRVEPSTAVARGTVTDDSGTPIEGALVEIGPMNHTTDLGGGRFIMRSPLFRKTGPSGRFEHTGLVAGRNRVWVERSGYLPHLGSVSVSAESASRYDVVLHRGCGVSGRVQTADGLPAAGAMVRVEFHPKDPSIVVQQAVADADGRYDLQGLAPGVLWFLAQHATLVGHTASASLEVEEGKTLTWNPVLQESTPLRLRIQGEDGSPFAEALVAVSAKGEGERWQRFLSSGADGRVQFDAVPSLELTAEVFLSPSDITLGVPPCHAWSGLRADPEEHVLAVPRESTGRGSIRGVLLDADGRPFAEARLQLRPRDSAYFYATAVDPKTGAFQNDRLTTQTYEIFAWCDGFGSWRLDEIEVLARDTFDLGEILLPRPVVWNAPWPTTPVPGETWELIKGDTFDAQFKAWPVAAGVGPPPPSFSLFPGKYNWKVYAQGKVLLGKIFELQ